MLLTTLLSYLPEAEVQHTLNPQLEFDSTEADSRLVRAGSLFFAVAGVAADGHRYIPAAAEQKAVAIIGTRPYAQLVDQTLAPPSHIPYIQVENSRHALAVAAAALEGFPGRQLTVIGVTGAAAKPPPPA
ncbi:MAG: Mur ligase domain-containing protein [Caldilineaceae bacterium]